MGRPAFSSQLQARLRMGKYTRWASDLTEDEVRELLWLVGEFGVRAPEQYGGSGAGSALRREGALCGLVQFVRGNSVTVVEAFKHARELGLVTRLVRPRSTP